MLKKAFSPLTRVYLNSKYKVKCFYAKKRIFITFQNAILVLESSQHGLKELINSMNKFEEARINAGLTIIQLATEAKVSRSTVEKMGRGEPVRAELAARACRVISQYLGQEVTYQSLEMNVII
jgi:DNA-binding XRE family transcriptional regulator